MFDGLEPADGTAELPAFLHIGDGHVQACLRATELLGGEHHTRGVERGADCCGRGCAVGEPGRDRLGEGDPGLRPGEVEGVQAGDVHPGLVGVDEEEIGPAAWLRHGRDDEAASAGAVQDEGRDPVEGHPRGRVGPAPVLKRHLEAVGTPAPVGVGDGERGHIPGRDPRECGGRGGSARPGRGSAGREGAGQHLAGQHR